MSRDGWLEAAPPQATGDKTTRREESSHRPAAISFGIFCLDLRSGRLLRGSEPIPLRPKTWAVLHYLAERPGALLTKDDLLEAVWAGVAVTESVLSKSIGELRVALGDSVKAPRFIETVPRRGFRFIASTGESLPERTSNEIPVTGNRLLFRPPSDRWSPVSDRVASVPFVGRAKEMQRLASVFTKASGGERQTVFITGSPGIGKTAMVQAFLDSPALGEAIAPVWIARGACIEQHGLREAYAPVIEALERLVRGQGGDRLAELLRRVAPTWLAQMPWLIGAEDEPALRQSLQSVRPERMLREFAVLIEALTTDVALLLVLEDLQWSDEPTVDLLWFLAQRSEPARLLVVGTFRPADAIVREHALMNMVRTLTVRRQCVELPLSDLREEDVVHYLRIRFPGSDFAPGLGRLIHQHTDGNPLFMVGVVDHLLSHGDILDTAPGWALPAPLEKTDLGVPDDVQLLIENDLEGLSPADHALLQAASVAGDAFSALVVAAALGGEVADVEMRCEAFAHSRRFLRVAEPVEWPDRSVVRRYAFVHELYRQVVYAEIAEGQCIQLHRRMGRALEAAYGARQMEIAPQLATHFERGRDDARTLHYLTAAAERARQRFADREAMGYIKAGLALLGRLPADDERRRRELDLRLLLGAILVDLSGFASEPVRENLTRAAALAAGVGSLPQRFGVAYAGWYVHAIRAERDATIASAAALDALARRFGTPQQRVVAASVLVRTATNDGRFAEATRLMQRRLARPHGPIRSAAPALGPEPRLVAAMHAAIALWFLGYPERARSTVRTVVSRARKFGHFVTLSAVLMQAALLELLCRNAAAGSGLADESVSLSAEHGFTLWSAAASVWSGWASVQQGHASQGNTAIAAALAAMQATGAQLLSDFAYAALAEGHLHVGTLADGLAAADAGLAATEATLARAYAPELWRLKGELLLKQVESRPSGVERSRASGTRPRVSPRRSTPNSAEAEHCFQRALDLSRATQAKSLERRAAASLARAWHARGRSAHARRLLGGVCRWFGPRARSVDLSEARALLRGELNSSVERRKRSATSEAET